MERESHTMAPDDKKLFIIIACVIAFGLLAGVVFYGTTGWLGP